MISILLSVRTIPKCVPSVWTVSMSGWTAGTLLYRHTVMQLSNAQWQVWNCILMYNIVGLIWTLPFVLLDARVSTLSIPLGINYALKRFDFVSSLWEIIGLCGPGFNML